ncbi:MAG: glycosyl transferase family 2, partial [Kiritimatiellae bacterium]|nr:glycosyl transferase family 2 [Kiritimatiellia bacterium]
GLALQNMFSVLSPGGHALVLVPQGQWLFGSLDEVLGHYRRYTPDQLADIAKKAGFVVVKLISFNRIGVPGWYLNAKMMKKTSFSKVQLKIYDSLVWLWRIIDRFLPWHGLSVIIVARKPMPSA